jgi:hypothetical protein
MGNASLLPVFLLVMILGAVSGAEYLPVKGITHILSRIFADFSGHVFFCGFFPPPLMIFGGFFKWTVPRKSV